jgi:phosphatidylglycerol:prolipoprotein diacylglycerol transferase
MNIGGTYYQPTFLYESIWNILVCIILLIILYKKNNEENGIVIGSYITLYSLGRVFIEGLRTDSLMLGSIRVAQLVSIAGMILGIGLILYVKRKRNIKA